jgi:hypothetical protein
MPTNLVASASSISQIDLSWNASAGATRYNILRALQSGGPYSLIAAGVAGNSYSDTNLTEDVPYYYIVTAINGTGESAASNEASATPTNGAFQEVGGVVSMEAEHGEVGNQWMIVANAGASGGEQIEVIPAFGHSGSSPQSTTEESLATYDFHITTPGNYRFWFRVFAATFDDDSFFWRIDNGGWNLENGRQGNAVWYSVDHAQVDNLTTGAHVLEITYRENGLGLDKFVLQLDSLTAPSGNGPAESLQGAGGSAAAASAMELRAMIVPVVAESSPSASTGGNFVSAYSGVAPARTAESRAAYFRPTLQSWNRRGDEELLSENLLADAIRRCEPRDAALQAALAVHSKKPLHKSSDWLSELAVELASSW